MGPASPQNVSAVADESRSDRIVVRWGAAGVGAVAAAVLQAYGQQQREALVREGRKRFDGYDITWGDIAEWLWPKDNPGEVE